MRGAMRTGRACRTRYFILGFFIIILLKSRLKLHVQIEGPQRPGTVQMHTVLVAGTASAAPGVRVQVRNPEGCGSPV